MPNCMISCLAICLVMNYALQEVYFWSQLSTPIAIAIRENHIKQKFWLCKLPVFGYYSCVKVSCPMLIQGMNCRYSVVPREGLLVHEYWNWIEIVLLNHFLFAVLAWRYYARNCWQRLWIMLLTLESFSWCVPGHPGRPVCGTCSCSSQESVGIPLPSAQTQNLHLGTHTPCRGLETLNPVFAKTAFIVAKLLSVWN